MKDEEFNNFLRERADSFELKPSSGSFDAVTRKMKKKNKRRGVFFILPLILVGVLAAAYFYTDNTNTKGSALAEKQEQAQLLPLESEQAANKNSVTANTEQSTSMLSSDEPSTSVNSIPQEKQPETNTVIQSVSSENNSLQQKPFKRVSQPVKSDDEVESAQNNVYKEPLEEVILTNEEQQEITGNESESTITKEQTETVLLVNETEDKDTDAKQEVPDKEEQETINPEEDCKLCNCLNKKWSVRAYANPFRSSYVKSISTLGNRDESAVLPSQQSTYYQEYSQEQFNSGLRLGANFERKLNKHITLGAGVSIANWNIDVTNWKVEYSYDSIFSYTYDSNSQLIVTGYDVKSVGETHDSSVTNYTFTSIQVPVYLGINMVQNKRFGFGVEAGLIASYTSIKEDIKYFQRQSNGTVANFNSATLSQNTYKQFNTNLALGLVADYTLGKCWGIYAAPRLSIPLLTINAGENYANKRPVFLGIEAGVKIKF